jgi:post-segregation antitoxin (ccd killing protein)
MLSRMAKKQSRRSISINRQIYERLKAHCEGKDISMSRFVEAQINSYLNALGGAPPPPTTN